MTVTGPLGCVAVVGPGEDASAAAIADATAVGRLLATGGWVTLTGGRDAGVMAAAASGATAAGGLAIGLLPTADSRAAAPSLTVALATGLGEARNAVLVSAALAVIGCGLNPGTVSELALALRARKPTVLVGASAEVAAFFATLAGTGSFAAVATPAAAVDWVAAQLATQRGASRGGA